MKKNKKIITYIFLSFGIILIIFPLYLTFVNSFKETGQISSNFLDLPSPFTLNNFQRLIEDGIVEAFANSTIITVSSILIILLFIPLASFAVSRKMDKNKFFLAIYIYCVVGIFVPFQIVMIPLTSTMSSLGLTNRLGVVILYLTYAVPQTLFLYAGFIKSVIPRELDEAAVIDGCGKFKMYFSVIFPLLKPMHATVIILNVLWIWNDFLLPVLMLNRNSSYWTLPLFQFNYQGEHFQDFGPSFAAYTTGIVTILIVYLIFQKNIISGMAQGSVK